MSKRIASNSVLIIDQVMNDINTWLVDKDCNQDEVEDNSDDLGGEVGEENKNNSDPTEQFFLEYGVIGSVDGGKEQPFQQRYGPRKQLIRNREVHGIDSSLDKANFEKIIYLNREGNFEEYV